MHKIRIIQGDGKGSKGRIFEGAVPTFVQWAKVKTTAKVTEDPIFMELCATEGQLRPLVANLRTAREATILDGTTNGKPLILNKTSPLSWTRTMVHPGGALVCAYMPDLFDLECGMIHETHARFVCMPPMDWVRGNARDLTADEMTMIGRMGLLDVGVDAEWSNGKPVNAPLEWLKNMFAVAVQFCARLDTRTNLPLIPDRLFKFLLMTTLLRTGACQYLIKRPVGPWPERDFVMWRDDDRYRNESWQPSPARYYVAVGVDITHRALAEFLPVIVRFWDRIRK